MELELKQHAEEEVNQLKTEIEAARQEVQKWVWTANTFRQSAVKSYKRLNEVTSSLEKLKLELSPFSNGHVVDWRTAQVAPDEVGEAKWEAPGTSSQIVEAGIV